MEIDPETEVVAECQVCGKDITAAHLLTLPYCEGEPVFVMCQECIEEDEKPDIVIVKR